MADLEKPNKLTGKVKWLDFQGIGYIVPDNRHFPEVFVTPLSLSSNSVIEEGDCVEFDIKLGGSEPNHAMEAIDVVTSKIYCFNCKRYGHKFMNCRKVWDSDVNKCYRCGLVGHSRRNCDQKLKGWFFDEFKKKKTVEKGIYGSCNGGSWLSLFGAAAIVCVNKKEDVKKVEEVEDCFILEFDPSELDKFSELSLCEKSNVVGDGDEDDLTILGEKGKVACRDYPHPRYLCAIHPFKKTSHVLHCKMCYCYICDVPAPCKKWSEAFKIYGLNHCDANDEICWRVRRDLEKGHTQVR